MSSSTLTRDEMLELVEAAAIYGTDGGSRPRWQPERPIRDWVARRAHRVRAIFRVRSRDRNAS